MKRIELTEKEITQLQVMLNGKINSLEIYIGNHKGDCEGQKATRRICQDIFNKLSEQFNLYRQPVSDPGRLQEAIKR